MFHKSLTLSDFDPALSGAIRREVQRQEDHIELIASENYTSPQVMQAQGTELTNKYAEGYPGKRYYGGCEHVDVVEQLAIDRAKQLFGAGYANVQPHSGSQANAAVYLALLQAGDTLLGMSLAHGGHLTHGAKVSSSGKLYNAVQYGIDANGLIDYDDVERLAVEHQPKMIVAGFSAYSKTLDFPRFRQIADKVGPVSILVNNAGIARRNGMLGTDEAVIKDWEDIISINLTGVFNVTHSFLAPLRKNKGRIVNIGSINGQAGQYGQVNYAAAKSGIHGFTKALAQEGARFGVTVNAIAPGYIDTDMVAAVPADVLEKIVAKIPVGRLGQAHEIARGVAFLCSDEAGFVTGSTLSINGGQHMY